MSQFLRIFLPTLSLANGIDATHKEEEFKIRRELNKPIPISVLFEQSFLGLEVTDSVVLGGVVEVVSSIPTVGHKYFSAFTDIVYLLYLSSYI